MKLTYIKGNGCCFIFLKKLYCEFCFMFPLNHQASGPTTLWFLKKIEFLSPNCARKHIFPQTQSYFLKSGIFLKVRTTNMFSTLNLIAQFGDKISIFCKKSQIWQNLSVGGPEAWCLNVWMIGNRNRVFFKLFSDCRIAIATVWMIAWTRH